MAVVENWRHEMRYDDGRRRDVPDLDLDPGLDPSRRRRDDLFRQYDARRSLLLRRRLGLRLASSPLLEVKGAIEWMDERSREVGVSRFVSSNPR